ncbi:group II intron reverse transcriptase/maturase [Listeria monocytogenes]
MQSLFDQVYQQSKNGNNFYKLIGLMEKEENILLAYRNIKKNMGSNTPGIDGKSIKDIQRLTNSEMIKKIRGMFKWYQPGSVRRVYIPKADGGKRPLGIPTIWDRLFQQCILQILEPICEAKFHTQSYGFRPNRSAHHAIARANHLMNNRGNGYHYCVDMDIKGFFDNVDHGKLLKQMWSLGIRDKKLLSIVSILLKAEIKGEGNPLKGTPQGGILSPLLANIVLNELDWWISDQWETFNPSEKVYTTQEGVRKSLVRMKRSLKQCYFVRYADDFKIFCRDYPTAKKLFHATQDFLKTRLHLEISPQKSKIVNLRKQRSEFLGFTFTVNPKNGGHVAHSRMTLKARKQVHEKLKKAVKDIAKKQTVDSVWRYNTTIMGVHNYYEVGTHINLDFDHLSNHMTKSMYNRLRRDWKLASKSDMNKSLIQRYWRYNPKWYKAHGIVLIPIYAWKHKYAIQFNPNICSYTIEGRKLIHSNLNVIDREVLRHVSRNYCPFRSIEYNDNRISKFVSQRGKCAITGVTLGLRDWECHHKIPLYQGGTDMFKNLIIILKELHFAIHNENFKRLLLLQEKYKISEDKLSLCKELFDLAKPIKG